MGNRHMKRGRWAVCCAVILALYANGASAQLPAANVRARAPATSLLTPLAKAGPGAIVIPRDSCGTHWTEWSDDPQADANPCPPACERGERQVLDSRKVGDETQYQARYECYLPELVVDQPPDVLLPVAGTPAPRSCGTAWTSAQPDPDTDLNPCPTNCDRGELQLVRRSLAGDGKARYEMRYQCYVAQPGGETTAQSPVTAAATSRTAVRARAGVSASPAASAIAPADGAPAGAILVNGTTGGNVVPGSGPWHTFVQVLSAEAGTATSARVVWYPNDDDAQPIAGMLSATLRGTTPNVGAQIEIPDQAGGPNGGTIRIQLFVPGATEPTFAGRFDVTTGAAAGTGAAPAALPQALAGNDFGSRAIDTSAVSQPGPQLSGVTPNGPGSITVSWLPAAGATRYEAHALERGRGDGPKIAVASETGKTAYSATFDGLAPGLTHDVWVVAFYSLPTSAQRGAEASGASELLAVQTPPPVNPASMQAELVGNDGVHLSWEPVAGATAYRLEGQHLPQTEVTATSLDLQQVPMGAYEWQVRALFNGIFMPENPGVAQLTIGTREAWVAQAYDEGLRRHTSGAPDATRWKNLAAKLSLPYDELVDAFDAIWIVNHAYWYLLQREATAEEAEPLIAALRSGATAWTEVWRRVAQSNERIQLRGAWAPAPMPSLGEARSVFGQPVLAHPENCFGAIGSHCDGGLEAESRWVDLFTMPDGTQMGSVEINVSVGSIFHDNLCIHNAYGLHCGEGNAWDWYVDVATFDPSAIIAKIVIPGAQEWNKAVWNTLDKRRWRQVFGPYPTDKDVRRASWYDDLYDMNAREGWMAPVLGAFTIPLHTDRYPGRESRGTRTLAAPAGALLDYRDAAFCRSGGFSGTKQEFGKADAGICR